VSAELHGGVEEFIGGFSREGAKTLRRKEKIRDLIIDDAAIYGVVCKQVH
jgi:hypothetical protein